MWTEQAYRLCYNRIRGQTPDVLFSTDLWSEGVSVTFSLCGFLFECAKEAGAEPPAAPQLLVVQPPEHQHGRVCSQNTPSVCSQLSQRGQSCQGAPLFGTLVSVRLSPEFGFFFPTLGMLPLPVHRVSSRSEGQIVSSLRFEVAFVLYPHTRRSAQQRRAAAAAAAAAQSAEAPG